MIKHMCVALAAVSFSFFTLSHTANAGEIRAGIWEHDAEFFGLGGSKGKETSAAASISYAWDSPDWLSWADSPKPYVGALINLDGNTNFVSGGLEWQGRLTDNVYAIYAFGIAAHDGTQEVPSPNFETDPVIIQNLVNRKAQEIEFGSTVLFRNAFGFGYNFSEDIGVELIWEHLSHAKIFDDVNEGIDNVGIRFNRRF